MRQLNYRGWDLTEGVLQQLKKSPVWKYRKNAAKLLIIIGKYFNLISFQEKQINKVNLSLFYVMLILF